MRDLSLDNLNINVKIRTKLLKEGVMRFNVSLDDVISSRSKLKILKHLFGQEAPMSESELASIVGVSHMTANRLMKKLAALNLVSVRRVGNANVWVANRGSFVYRALSNVVKELSKVPRPLEDLKETIRRQMPANLVDRVVLFGSIAQGSEEETSDIDLFVLVKSDEARKEIQLYLERLSSDCLSLYGNSLAPYVLTPLELEQRKNLPLLKEIKRGIEIEPRR